MSTTYGTPTMLDNYMSLAYASDRVLKELMSNKDIVSRICKGKNQDCLKYIPDNFYKKWRDIYATDPDKNCSTDTDCNQNLGEKCIQDDFGKKLCGYSTNDVSSGMVHINDKSFCLEKSKMPVICDKNSCYKNKDSTYLEWRENSVLDDKSKNDQLNGKCILGNWALKNYAENPVFRGWKDPEAKPDDSKKDDSKKDTWDDQKFFYDDTVGKIYMTPDYCNYYDTNFGSGDCSNDSVKCPDNKNCYEGIDGKKICEKRECTLSDKTKCLPDEKCSLEFCKENCGEKGVCINDTASCIQKEGSFVDMLFSKTLVRLFDSAAFGNGELALRCITGGSKEDFDPKDVKKNLFNIFNSYKDLKKNIDDKFIINKKLVKNNFAGNINLYKITWKKESKNEDGIGFIASEVEKNYPNLIKNNNGIKFLEIKKNDIKDNNIKKLFLFGNGLAELLNIKL